MVVNLVAGRGQAAMDPRGLPSMRFSPALELPVLSRHISSMHKAHKAPFLSRSPASGPTGLCVPAWILLGALLLGWGPVALAETETAAGIIEEAEAEGEAEAEVAPAPLWEKPSVDFATLHREVPKPKITPRVLQKATPDSTNLYISLTQQKAYLFVGNEVAIETPISSGRRAAMTPHGSFSIVEKSEKVQTNSYGDFVDKQGRIVQRGVSAKLDSAPSGTTFRPQPMRYFLRLNWTGLGLHAGHLPGYPASQVHVRFPEEIARLIFEHTRVGTPVVIGD